ncbi:MAG TPA: MBL fold metallo-hydrolase [Ktedonobacteraceae bacterium]|nr:MBL fold metallo-hydrolase [Ktedonobacteraceae bacterium]
MSDLSLQEIAPGVHAALGGICNRGLIAQGGSVLVVDSGIAVAEAVPLRAAAQERQKDRALYLFNTHPHGDHVYGNQLFTDDPIIAHEGVRNDLIAHGEQVLAGWRKNPQMATLLSDVIITPPTLTFQDQMTLFIGDIEVHLLYLAQAHSPSDSVAWLPQSRTLFTGDLLFNALVPAMPPGGSVANWIQALEKLEALDVQHAIPGHGPIQTASALADLRQWFLSLRTQVGDAQALGWDRETTITQVAQQLQKRTPRGNEERLPNVIGQAFDELSRA